MADSYLTPFITLLFLLIFLGCLLYACRGPSCLIIFLLILLFVYFQNEYVIKEGSSLRNNTRIPGNRFNTRKKSMRYSIRGYGKSSGR
jgi:hypothetical protein